MFGLLRSQASYTFVCVSVKEEQSREGKQPSGRTFSPHWNMAETGKERDPEIDKVKENEEGENNGESSLTDVPNKSLAELNMLLVSLSLVSSSVDDVCMEQEVSEHNNVKHKVSASKTSISRLQALNGDLYEPKLAKRSSSTRLHTTIRDCRHGRKM